MRAVASSKLAKVERKDIHIFETMFEIETVSIGA
jgi:hypothetical protein